MASTVSNGGCTPNNGSIVLTVAGGVSPYNFDWADLAGANNPQNRSGLAAGNYSVTMTDGGGCTKTGSFTIAPVSGAINLTAVLTHVKCFGGNDGRIVPTTSGGIFPYQFDWADLPGPNNPTNRQNLVVGNYSLTVSDGSGCTVSMVFNINQPPVLQITGVTATQTASNPNKYTAVVNASGGTPPLQFRRSKNTSPQTWTAYSSSNTFTNLLAGTYIFNVKDAKNCSVSQTVIVPIPPPQPFQIVGNGGAPATEPIVFLERNGLENEVLELSPNHVGLSMLVFPNPATDILNVEFVSEKDLSGSISIEDLLGKTVFFEKTKIVDGSIFQIPIQKLPAGTYILTFRDEAGKIRSNALKFIPEGNQCL